MTTYLYEEQIRIYYLKNTALTINSKNSTWAVIQYGRFLFALNQHHFLQLQASEQVQLWER